MPTKIGNTNIGKVFLGNNTVESAFLGNTLVYRNWVWADYYYQYIYNSLVPSVIDDKNVRNKAKVNTIYGNTVVENQLIDAIYKNATFSTSSTDYQIARLGFINTINTHRYLFSFKCTKSSNASIRLRFPYISSVLSSGNNILLFVPDQSVLTEIDFQILSRDGNNATATLNNIQLIDLTKMFPFDTPTTLNDKRVQKILNSDYIAYNTGTLKNVDVSEISSEPYNIWDEEWEQGYYNPDNGSQVSNENRIRSKNFIQVLGNVAYTIEITNDTSNYCTVIYFDKSYNIIGNYTSQNSSSFTTPTNCSFIKFYTSGTYYGGTYNNNICFHRTGTRTGYAPHTQPQTIYFTYQGNGVGTAHDTLEITSSEYVFTKNMGIVLASSLTWVDYGGRIVSSTLNDVISGISSENVMPNLLFNKYKTSIFNDNVDKTITQQNNKWINVRDSSLTASSFTSSLTNNDYIEYQLATPQVINIPKKHLGYVDLGSLEWLYRSVQNQERFYAVLPNGKLVADNVVGNIYCINYKTSTWNDIRDRVSNNLIAISSVGGVCNVFAYNTSYTDATTFKTAMNGIYIFYETNNETTDMPNIIDIQSGGTLTTDSDVLPNITFGMKAR